MSLRTVIEAFAKPRRRMSMFDLAPTVKGGAKERDEAVWDGATQTLADKLTPWRGGKGVKEAKHPADALSLKAKEVSAAATDRAGYLAAAAAHAAAAEAHDLAGHIQKKVKHQRYAKDIRASADRRWPIKESVEISGEEEATRMSALRVKGRHGAPLAPEDHAHFAAMGPYVKIHVDPKKINTQYDHNGTATIDDLDGDPQRRVVKDYEHMAGKSEFPAITASVAPNGTIIAQDGNHRVMAARSYGKPTIAVHVPKSHLKHLKEDAGPYDMRHGAPQADLSIPAGDSGSPLPVQPDLATSIRARLQKKKEQAAQVGDTQFAAPPIVRDNQPPDINRGDQSPAAQMPPDLR